jgi:cellulose synthase/poly-beta-1,6-N-acetylglucosamine synthase-like glycosyltransferase
VIFWGFIIFACLLYIFLAGFIISGWIRTKSFTVQDGFDHPFVSVIIPVRNDSAGLDLLMSDLANQNWPEDKFEIIIVDDHSKKTINNSLSGSESKINIHRLSLGINEHGKKAALMKGLNASNSELILTTDADCRVTPFWITEMANFYFSKKVKLVFGSVLYYKSNKLNDWFQGLEYLSLVAAGAGFAGNGHPILCSAASMGFERTSYLEFVKETNSSDSVSGDDVLFMLWLKKKYPGQARFIKSCNSIVETKPAQSFKEFINQRLRWTSKSRYYRDPAIIFTALTVYLESLALLILLIGSFFAGFLIKGFLILFLCKCISDLAVLYIVTGYYRNRYLLKIFIPLEMVYFIYISFIGFAGNLASFNWKGRKSGP